MGIDFGLKNIGIALGQVLTRTSQALTTLPAHQGQPNWQKFHDLYLLWQPDAFILGLPLNMDGSEQTITQETKKFSIQLQERFQKPIYWVDERLSTVQARSNLFERGGYRALGKKDINREAARLIVETWFYGLNGSVNP